MGSKIRIIMCAVDLTDNSDRVIEEAVRAANAYDAQVHLLHINESFDTNVAMPIVSFMGEERFKQLIEEKKSETEDEISRRLDNMAAEGKAGIKTGDLKRIKGIHVMEGDPVVEILNMASAVKADMLVLGTHGKGIVVHTFLGSVAQKIVKRVSVPVLLVPAVPRGRS